MPLRAVMFYPWDDLATRSGGAALRCNLLLDHLAPHFESICVLQSGDTPLFRRGSIEVQAAPKPWHLVLVRRAFRLLAFPFLGRARFGQELYLWHHLDRRLDKAFARRVRDMVRHADVVLLEYSFWAHAVLRACREFGVPCVLTQHDVLAEQAGRSGLLRRLTASIEIKTLQRAAHVVAVSPQDAQYFAAHSIAATVIPNPADLGRLQEVPKVAACAALLERHGIALPNGPLCLFVGSRFPPNIEAAESIAQLATEVPEVGFVVAGACVSPRRRGNFLALGVVPDEALVALYAASDFVLVPLRRGGGSSLKTVEAMAAGKTVLGTTVAFRGLPVRHGESAIVEDELARWPAILRDLLTSPTRCVAIGAAGRRVAQNFDSAHVLRAYLPLLGLDQ